MISHSYKSPEVYPFEHKGLCFSKRRKIVEGKKENKREIIVLQDKKIIGKL